MHIIYPSRVVLKFSWYSEGLDFKNENIFFNHEFLYVMILKFLHVYDMRNNKRYFKAKQTNIFHVQGVSYVLSYYH